LRDNLTARRPDDNDGDKSSNNNNNNNNIIHRRYFLGYDVMQSDRRLSKLSGGAELASPVSKSKQPAKQQKAKKSSDDENISTQNEVTGGRRKQRNEKLHNLHFFFKFKSRRMR
jgi:hypothetical protein